MPADDGPVVTGLWHSALRWHARRLHFDFSTRNDLASLKVLPLLAGANVCQTTDVIAPAIRNRDGLIYGLGTAALAR